MGKTLLKILALLNPNLISKFEIQNGWFNIVDEISKWLDFYNAMNNRNKTMWKYNCH